ncbi:Ribosome LSU-associated GTP-binding protein HflX [hydrothermal vent metagenome]|uniref:Ribosome LSU-associated GTP-binding protein HflX n=1 Tax=hydrothermal vent metagenome TaxID=652676 RepID=A0A3B1E772_9ZZZZ
MSNPKREELSVQEKRAILAAVHSPQSPISKENVLNELHGLVKTAGVEVVGEIVQMRDKPHIATCFGKGKVEELKQLVASTDAELVIFDNNLTPAQGRNLEEALDTVIVDRSEVILDIFASSARTHAAMLQVELAQLLYFRPRLKRLWTHLERIEGGVGAGRGPGEKQLETDRRLLDKRVSELKAKLKIIEGRRHRMVETRTQQPTVSLVGYTNAGKSTLMRMLTGADVLVADKLFATLDTRTRRWSVPNWGDVLLSDTVGFVRNLPHHLVASFRSTLEEARHADLLLHVVDASHSEAELQIETVYKVLEEVGVEYENVLLVLNKLDACQDRSLVDVLRLQYDDVVTMSAVTGEGLDRLYEEIRQRLGSEHVTVTIETSAGNGKLISDLAKHAEVLDTNYHDSRVTFNCRMSKRFLYRFENDTEETTVFVRE